MITRTIKHSSTLSILISLVKYWHPVSDVEHKKKKNVDEEKTYTMYNIYSNLVHIYKISTKWECCNSIFHNEKITIKKIKLLISKRYCNYDTKSFNDKFQKSSVSVDSFIMSYTYVIII